MHPSSPFSKLSSSSKQWLSRHSRDPYIKKRVFDEPAYRSRSAYKLLEMDDKFHFLSGLRRRNNPDHPRIIIDLGAAPGGWSQVAAFRTGHFIVSEKTGNLPEETPFGLKEKDEGWWHTSRNNKDEGWWHNPGNNKDEKPPNKQKLPTIIALDLHRMGHINGVISLQADFLLPATEVLIRKHLPPLYQSNSVDLLLSDMAANTTGNSTVDTARSLEISEAVFHFACRHLARRANNGSGGAMILKYFQHPDSTQFCKTYLQPSFRSVTSFKPPSSRSESSERYWVCLGFLGYRTPPDRIPDNPSDLKDLRAFNLLPEFT